MIDSLAPSELITQIIHQYISVFVLFFSARGSVRQIKQPVSFLVH